MDHKKNILKDVKVIDLFCGIGGLTHGFESEGFNVVAGIDIDGKCEYGYKNSNHAEFIHEDISKVKTKEIKKLFNGAKIKVLIGCAPCQPYSGLNKHKGENRNVTPLMKFAEIIKEVKPDIISMENVRGLANPDKYPEFANFLDILHKTGYKFDYQVIDTSDYGIPQTRHRLVLLASRYGEIKLIDPTTKNKKITVRDVIGNLDPISDGEVSKRDILHQSSKLSELNKERIKATPIDGGNSSSWSKKLLPKCYLKESGKTYKNTVYGRMRWDQPAPTMTTQCIGLGNGRFGHPEQNRAISLREAAIFQTFPKDYIFCDPKDFHIRHVAKFIGNAVPVKLGGIIAQSIKNHLNVNAKQKSV